MSDTVLLAYNATILCHNKEAILIKVNWVTA